MYCTKYFLFKLTYFYSNNYYRVKFKCYTQFIFYFNKCMCVNKICKHYISINTFNLIHLL